jgi:hypothetical protein
MKDRNKNSVANFLGAIHCESTPLPPQASATQPIITKEKSNKYLLLFP